MTRFNLHGHLRVRGYSEDWSSRFLRIGGKFLPDYAERTHI